MAVVTDGVVRYSADEAQALVERLREIGRAAFERQVFGHRYMQELMAGTLPLPKLKGFFLNWYRFALEINTVKSEAYNHWLPFLERHTDCYDMFTTQIADELIHPGPGGHVKMLYIAGEALGISREDMVEAILIPEARALVDCRIRALAGGAIRRGGGVVDDGGADWDLDGPDARGADEALRHLRVPRAVLQQAL